MSRDLCEPFVQQNYELCCIAANRDEILSPRQAASCRPINDAFVRQVLDANPTFRDRTSEPGDGDATAITIGERTDAVASTPTRSSDSTADKPAPSTASRDVTAGEPAGGGSGTGTAGGSGGSAVEQDSPPPADQDRASGETPAADVDAGFDGDSPADGTGDERADTALGNPGNARDVGRAGETPNDKGGFNAPSEGGPGTRGRSDG